MPAAAKAGPRCESVEGEKPPATRCLRIPVRVSRRCAPPTGESARGSRPDARFMREADRATEDTVEAQDPCGKEGAAAKVERLRPHSPEAGYRR